MTICRNHVAFARIGCRARLALALALPALGGCTTMAPLQMTYHWRPLGTNQSNIEAQSNAPDLVHGRPLGDADAHEAAVAVQRWRDGKVMDLGNSGLAEMTLQSSGSGSGSGASAGAAP